MLTAFLIGFVAAFLSSMPVAGPIAALVVSRSIMNRYKSAMMLAMGSGIAEACYAFLAVWGFSTFLTQYPWVLPASKGLAALILLGLGYYFTKHKSPDGSDGPSEVEDGWWGSFAMGTSITALNPTLIATWSAAATALFSADVIAFEPRMSLPFAVGVCLGTIAWFGFLVGLLKRYKHNFKQETLDRGIQLMGWVLMALGVYFAVVFVEFMAAWPDVPGLVTTPSTTSP